MTIAEFYTSLFYTWEFRGRGWFVADHPVELEPPFIPYYRHGYPGDSQQFDDGKRHTLRGLMKIKRYRHPIKSYSIMKHLSHLNL